ncbi:hypothetical protein J6590_074389 [Homalodisca vitripennis]|nr:hypothetical protein J6590_074389 [Homalodisca vitripennis]
MAKGRAKKDFSTRHIGLKSDETIYVNECLTPTRRRLLGMTRDFKKKNNYQFVWVRGVQALVIDSGLTDHRLSAVLLVREGEDTLSDFKVTEPQQLVVLTLSETVEMVRTNVDIARLTATDKAETVEMVRTNVDIARLTATDKAETVEMVRTNFDIARLTATDKAETVEMVRTNVNIARLTATDKAEEETQVPYHDTICGQSVALYSMCTKLYCGCHMSRSNFTASRKRGGDTGAVSRYNLWPISRPLQQNSMCTKLYCGCHMSRSNFTASGLISLPPAREEETQSPSTAEQHVHKLYCGCHMSRSNFTASGLISLPPAREEETQSPSTAEQHVHKLYCGCHISRSNFTASGLISLPPAREETQVPYHDTICGQSVALYSRTACLISLPPAREETQVPYHDTICGQSVALYSRTACLISLPPAREEETQVPYHDTICGQSVALYSRTACAPNYIVVVTFPGLISLPLRGDTGAVSRYNLWPISRSLQQHNLNRKLDCGSHMSRFYFTASGKRGWDPGAVIRTQFVANQSLSTAAQNV